MVAIGICNDRGPFNGFPGWDLGTYGYHADDGKVFNNEMIREWETFGPGDTVGCGVDFRNNTLFFTKNGKLQGMIYSAEVRTKSSQGLTMCVRDCIS